MTYLHINNESLTELQTFQSVEEMNESIKEHKQAHDLTETDRNILDAISRYACKYKGVCYLSKQRIAEDAGYKSRRTAIRSCKRLEALGIITTHETRRQGGDRRRSTDIIVINEANRSTSNDMADVKTFSQTANFPTSGNMATDESSEVTAESHSQEALYKTINSSNTDDSTPTVEQVIHESIANNTPKPIVELLSPFFYGSELYKYVGIIFKAKYRPYVNLRIEEHLSDFKACIYDVIRRHKAGHIRNLEAYLYKSIQALSRRLFMEQAQSDAI